MWPSYVWQPAFPLLQALPDPPATSTCRSAERAQDALTELRAKAKAASQHGQQWGPVESMPLDLSSLRSVHRFTAEYARRGLGVDVLVNNAGVMAPPNRIVTEDGLEAQFQVWAFIGLCQQSIRYSRQGQLCEPGLFTCT